MEKRAFSCLIDNTKLNVFMMLCRVLQNVCRPQIEEIFSQVPATFLFKRHINMFTAELLSQKDICKWNSADNELLSQFIIFSTTFSL
jgi:hypothetical protein